MSEGKADKQKTPSDSGQFEEFSDLDQGWSWVVMLATFGNFCIIGAFIMGVGIIHTALVRKYRESVSMTSLAGTLLVAVTSLGAPLSSAVVDKFSCRTAVILSGMCYMTGYLGTAFAPNMEVAIFTCGIISGIGGGLGYTANAAAIGLNFKTRRNLALGFALSGHGVGLFVFAPLMQFALDFYGPSGFFITMATISANTVAFGVMIFPTSSHVGQVMYFVLLGLFSGSCYILLASIGIRLVGIHFVSAVIGIQLFFCGVGTVVGPVCSGLIVDNGGTYKQCFILAAVSIFLAAKLSACTLCCRPKPQIDEPSEQQTNNEQTELMVVSEKSQ